MLKLTVLDSGLSIIFSKSLHDSSQIDLFFEVEPLGSREALSLLWSDLHIMIESNELRMDGTIAASGQ